jgi:hypothetical protein
MRQHAEPPDARPAPDPCIGSGNYKPLIRFGSSARRSMPMSSPDCEWGISLDAPGVFTRKTEVTRCAPRPTPAGMPIAAPGVSRCEAPMDTPHSQSSVSWAPKRHRGGARPQPASRAAIRPQRSDENPAQIRATTASGHDRLRKLPASCPSSIPERRHLND